MTLILTLFWPATKILRIRRNFYHRRIFYVDCQILQNSLKSSSFAKIFLLYSMKTWLNHQISCIMMTEILISHSMQQYPAISWSFSSDYQPLYQYCFRGFSWGLFFPMAKWMTTVSPLAFFCLWFSFLYCLSVPYWSMHFLIPRIIPPRFGIYSV